MRHLHFVFIVAFSMGLATLSHAQTGTSGSDTTGSRSQLSQSVFGLGANFSPLSGLGLSVRQHFPAKFSYMFTGYYAKTSDGSYYSYGAELQYDLVLKDRVRFYVLGGASYFYDDFPTSTVNSDNVTIPPFHNTFLGPTRFGGGFGIETNLIGDDFCVMLDLVVISFQPVGDFIPMGSGALHYYFR